MKEPQLLALDLLSLTQFIVGGSLGLLALQAFATDTGLSLVRW